jgi:RNA polymerase sigma-70 factor (ECF subfamily)
LRLDLIEVELIADGFVNKLGNRSEEMDRMNAGPRVAVEELDRHDLSTEELQTNEQWLEALRAGRTRQAHALERLRTHLMRGLMAYLSQRSDLARRSLAAREALAEDMTQEALMAILDQLDSFRGESKFLTWASKIAVYQAISALRRQHWQDVSFNQMTANADDELSQALEWPDVNSPDPEQALAQRELADLLQRIIHEELTDRQRQVLVAVHLRGMPVAEVARQMETNRNALYKMMHDARKRLKKRLEAAGVTTEEALAAFVAPG